MTFNTEAEFENALIQLLTTKGWDSEIIKYPTEQDLLDNWAEILFNNNRGRDRLNDQPLTKTEMEQIVEQIKALKTPLKLNGFINGKSVTITRDNPNDSLHLGKEISLQIYDRLEIANGKSRYQIVQQPQFPTKNPILKNRRGDIMLLINGMPVFHLELKKSGVPISQACEQIKKYAQADIFTGLFGLVQIFVAMTPEETKYFANADNDFKEEYFFNWADFNNEPINDYKNIASSLLSIPMAHQLIGFYTVADNNDGVLKVMRSYQYFASSAIADKVASVDWDTVISHEKPKGGYIWHTTGSGKTMTSFKSAQLIANSQNADKVVFLMDRIELGNQSLKEYKKFADDDQSVQATEDTTSLINKLTSNDNKDTLIVSSIQKMSNLKHPDIVYATDDFDEKAEIAKNAKDDCVLTSADIEKIQAKRIVFIIDEAHRSTFGDMLKIIKQTFPRAILFGFTGTPIFEENQKRMNTTTSIFGDALHRYSIADGIRDKNVLGFDPYMVATFKDNDIRKAVALYKAKADSEKEVWGDSKKEKVFTKYMDSKQIPMVGYYTKQGKYQKGIEDEIPKSQYEDEHQDLVVADITEQFTTLSRGEKFHAIFATSSITDAITYYRKFKAVSELKVTALFDPNEGNEKTSIFKEQGLAEIIDDYNSDFEQQFTIAKHAKFKEDIALRLAHKEQYTGVSKTDKQLDVLIVVDQMLTGYDSKWVNTLYLDKIIKYEGVIQAMSRTNRLFGHDKPFGTIRYYRKPHTMQSNIEKAVALYSGDRPISLFANKLEHNLKKLNSLFDEISDVFRLAGIENFVSLPTEQSSQKEFAKLFNEFDAFLEASLIQGFVWETLSYEFPQADNSSVTVGVNCDKTSYQTLLLRYKELFGDSGAGGSGVDDVPFDVKGHIIEISTGRIDYDYINDRYNKFIKAIDTENMQSTLDELHKNFATLSAEQQKYAELFLHDVQRGDVVPDANKSFIEYITEYMSRSKSDAISEFADNLGLDETKLREMLDLGLNKDNINEYGRLDTLKATVDKPKAKAHFEKLDGSKLPAFKVNIRIDSELRRFIVDG